MANYAVTLSTGEQLKYDLGATIDAVKTAVKNAKAAGEMVKVPDKDVLLNPDEIVKIEKI